MQNINIVSKITTTPTTTTTTKGTKVTKKKIKREEKKIETPLNATLGRSKMIHTQKTRVPVEIGTEGVKKGQKTKTMITRTPKLISEAQQHKLGIFPGGERNRPRTKNVSYHVETKQLTPATFPLEKENNELMDKSVSSPEIPPDTEEDEDNNEEDEEEDEEAAVAGNENSLINVKLEPGLRNNHNHEEKNLIVKKRAVGRRGRKPKAIVIKQEPREEVIESERIEQEILDGNAMEVAFEANVVATEESILPDLDKGNNIETMTTSMTIATATATEESEEEDEEEEVTTTKTKKKKVAAMATEGVETEIVGRNLLKENVKINVKVESTPQSVVAAHNLIAPSDETAETIIPDSLESLEHTCEMCSAVFPSHAELLVHVPIHI